jgi:formylglycine-generating enzyme required for sulfatase activity
MDDMRTRLIYLILIAGVIFLAGCSAPDQEPVNINPTQTSAEVLETATSTSAPVQSSTPEPTSTPLPTETPPAVEPEAGAERIWEQDGSVMVYVPSGNFLMGTDEENDQADNDEYPQHEVYLDGFWIDRYEVTNQQYEICVDAGACDPPSESGSFTRDIYFTQPEFANYPVIWINWHDANRYCEWAGKKLPTEAQWEKAARGTDAREYPWGDELIDETRANFGSNVGDTTEAGFYSPQGDSPYGCADMAGNVLEWVMDWYSGAYHPILDQVENPSGASSSSIGARVARGGSWIYPARRARSALRVDRVPELREGNIGFRCIFSY